MAIVTGNPIGLLLTLTYTVETPPAGSVKISPMKCNISVGGGAVSIKPIVGKVTV